MKLLRVYPRAWRARYGDELAVLIEELDGGRRMSWRTGLDVVRAGAIERARVFGVSGLPPRERAREGSLLVLYAWMLFVLGGFGVQKASEHWQAVTPAARQGVPAAAFDVLVVTAGVGSALVLLGVATSLPRLATFLRDGGWPKLRRPLTRATVLSLLAVVATFGLAAWAHSLTPAARNGSDPAYSLVFLAWVALFAGCLFASAMAAAAAARQLTSSIRTLTFELWLGIAVTAAMAVMTIATAVWWASLARLAPWFFDGRPIGSSASAFEWNIAIPAMFMVGATALGLIGATRAARAHTRISAYPNQL